MGEIFHNVDADVNKSCGFHLHIGDQNMTTPQKACIAHEWIRNEPTIDKLMPPSRQRRRNQYAYGWRHYHRPGMQEKLRTVKQKRALQDIVNPSDRYWKLNYRTPYPTIEVRQHSATTDSKKMLMWKDFVTGFAEHSIDKPDIGETADPDELGLLLTNIATELPEEKQTSFINYYTERGEKFETAKHSFSD